MSQNWLSSEDNPCLLVCFSLLQLPLSQLCLSSVCLLRDLLLLSMTPDPDHHITLMIDIKGLSVLSKIHKRASYNQQILSSHVLSTELVQRDAWYDLFQVYMQHYSDKRLHNFCTTLSPPKAESAGCQQRPGGCSTLPPLRPVSCVSLCRLSTALRKHAWTHHHCPDR